MGYPKDVIQSVRLRAVDVPVTSAVGHTIREAASSLKKRVSDGSLLFHEDKKIVKRERVIEGIPTVAETEQTVISFFLDERALLLHGYNEVRILGVNLISENYPLVPFLPSRPEDTITITYLQSPFSHQATQHEVTCNSSGKVMVDTVEIGHVPLLSMSNLRQRNNSRATNEASKLFGANFVADGVAASFGLNPNRQKLVRAHSRLHTIYPEPIPLFQSLASLRSAVGK